MADLKFKNSNGSGQHVIKNGPGLNYLKSTSPFAFNWLSDGGFQVLSEHIVSVPSNWKLKSDISKLMNEEMEIDEDSELNALALKKIDPLLSIFENGNYTIEYHVQFHPNKIYIPKPNYKRYDPELFLKNNPEFHFVDNMNDGRIRLIDPYESDAITLIGSQSNVEEKRINYYRDKIQKGFRPCAIILSSVTEETTKHPNGVISIDEVFSAFYVIDGHHKLLAYNLESIKPTIISIVHYPSKPKSVLPDLEDVFNQVQPWHFASMMREFHMTEANFFDNQDSISEMILNYYDTFPFMEKVT